MLFCVKKAVVSWVRFRALFCVKKRLLSEKKGRTMYQGFYDLASGMITQRRNLNTISNNMVNVQTAGYKKDTMVSTTFKEEMMIRTGKYNKKNPEDLAIASRIKSAARTYTDYEQGAYEQTDGIYDTALGGNGFYAIRTDKGTMYTRSGNFSVNENGVLELAGIGKVQSEDGKDIVLPNDNFAIDPDGSIYDPQSTGTTRTVYEKIKVVDFQDYTALHKEDNNMFSTTQAELPKPAGTTINWKMLEKSNVDMVGEMTTMMSSQRSLQSAAQMLKMYDSVMSKASSDVGRL